MQRVVKIGVFILCLLPFIWLLYHSIVGRLGPDPAEAIMLFTGAWSLRILALTLLVSPLREWTGNPMWLRSRRMLGLFAFFYACVHFLTFLQFYTGWGAAAVVKELSERPYISLGFLAWSLMLPLAVTSTRAMQRRLRGNWQRLHRLIYPAAILACLHLLWQARSDVGEAAVYIVTFALLLVWRVKRRRLRQHRAMVVRA